MSDGILVLNAGSSSIKFAVYSTARNDPAIHLRGQISGIGAGGEGRFTARDANDKTIPFAPGSGQHLDETVPASNHRAALDTLLGWLQRQVSEITLIGAGHRVVHGGERRCDPVLVDAHELEQLARLNSLAPHHQPHNLAAIEALAIRDPDLKQVACFDTAFHARQSATTRRLPLPREFAEQGLMRYGFHGSSYEYISGEVRKLGREGISRVLIAHLGNGGSLCAVKDGVSVATTMGFSTLDGLMMGTRCGALDPGVVLHLMQQFQLTENELHELFYNRSGLLGVSGISADMAELLASDAPSAREAIDLYCHSLVKNIGAMVAAMQGVDAIVFTGGIGENAVPVRAQVCRQLAWLGVDLDAERNQRNALEITSIDSRLPVWVIPTNEELVIARHTVNLVINQLFTDNT